jgi:hypothetical protein
MTGPTEYPSSWRPAGAPPADTAPSEAVAMAIDSYIAALSPEEFNQLVQRTRG